MVRFEQPRDNAGVETQKPGHFLPKPTFRRDIQGLRGIAVILVVLYHFGAGVDGGFLGVDVFFVISGFVISQLLINEILATKRIGLGEFLYRRFVRLVPALTVAVTVTSIAESFLLAPSPRQVEALWTAVGSVLGVSNIVIEQVSGGYFGSAPDRNILVHTWSLSVEWQFYLFLPLLFVIALAIGRRFAVRQLTAITWAVSAVSVASFTLANLSGFIPLSGAIGAVTGFYSPVARAWEFGIGILAYLIVSKYSASNMMSKLLGGLGFLLVVGG